MLADKADDPEQQEHWASFDRCPDIIIRGAVTERFIRKEFECVRNMKVSRFADPANDLVSNKKPGKLFVIEQVPF